MNDNNQINYVFFEVENIIKALDSAAECIRYDYDELMAERIEVALYAFRTSIGRLNAAHDMLKEALRELRVKQCCVEEKENAESQPLYENVRKKA